MQQKTNIEAAEGRQEIRITREFDLPVDLLFKAFTTADLVEQWMGTRVLTLENKAYGSYRFQTTDPAGNLHGFSGVIHEFVPGKKITRTFEMENTGFAVQLEFLSFDALSPDTSKLCMHVIFKSEQLRNQLLQLPFAQGINWAHNRLQSVAEQLK